MLDNQAQAFYTKSTNNKTKNNQKGIVMSKRIDSLMQREMSRKEFLATLGFGAATLMGFSSILQMVTGKDFSNHGAVTTGYGSSAYGGSREH
jgi:hypothetical protein